MATASDLEQNGRDTNVVEHGLGENIDLEPIENYGRLGKALYRLIQMIEERYGTEMKYAGRVDTYEDLLLITGQPNQYYLVGLENAESFDEYFWAVPNPADPASGHWDRLGGISISIDSELSLTSENPVQNKVVTAALGTKANSADLAPVARSGAYSDLSGKPSLAPVATSGDYNDLLNAPEEPDLTPYAKSAMIADPYDSTATYADGDLFTFEGELYKVDSVNGQYISTGNLITAEVMSAAGGFINGQIPTYTGGAYTPETFNSRWDYRTSGYIEVTPGMTLSINVGGSYSTGYYYTCDSFYNADKTRIGVYHPDDGITSHTTRSYVIPANVKYVRIGLGPANYQPSPVAKLVRADMPKVVKTTVDSELNAKANSSDLATVATSGDYTDLSNKPTIPDAVTVTQTGDMYIGEVCVRKVLTQAEYDLLDPPDERCDYLIIPASNG